MNLQPFDQRAGHGRLEGLVPRGRLVGVEVVHDQDHLLGVRIADLQQVAHLAGEIDGGASFGHGDVAAPGQGFTGQEPVGGSTTLVFVVHPFGLTRFDRQGNAGLRHPLLDRFLG